LQQLSRQTSQ